MPDSAIARAPHLKSPNPDGIVGGPSHLPHLKFWEIHSVPVLINITGRVIVNRNVLVISGTSLEEVDLLENCRSTNHLRLYLL